MSSYFAHFPSISYDIEGNLNTKEIIAKNNYMRHLSRKKTIK